MSLDKDREPMEVTPWYDECPGCTIRVRRYIKHRDGNDLAGGVTFRDGETGTLCTTWDWRKVKS